MRHIGEQAKLDLKRVKMLVSNLTPSAKDSKILSDINTALSAMQDKQGRQ
jgi:hypothetical protein